MELRAKPGGLEVITPEGKNKGGDSNLAPHLPALVNGSPVDTAIAATLATKKTEMPGLEKAVKGGIESLAGRAGAVIMGALGHSNTVARVPNAPSASHRQY